MSLILLKHVNRLQILLVFVMNKLNTVIETLFPTIEELGFNSISSVFCKYSLCIFAIFLFNRESHIGTTILWDEFSFDLIYCLGRPLKAILEEIK